MQPEQQPQQQETHPSLNQATTVQANQSSGVKTAGGTLTLLYGLISLIIGGFTILQSVLFGVIIVVLGVYWVVSGIRIFLSKPSGGTNTLQSPTAVAIGYAGILLIVGIFIPGFRLSAAILPIIFAITMAVLSNKFGAQLRK